VKAFAEERKMVVRDDWDIRRGREEEEKKRSDSKEKQRRIVYDLRSS
jgi:hypothetical protein